MYVLGWAEVGQAAVVEGSKVGHSTSCLRFQETLSYSGQLACPALNLEMRMEVLTSGYGEY